MSSRCAVRTAPSYPSSCLRSLSSSSCIVPSLRSMAWRPVSCVCVAAVLLASAACNSSGWRRVVLRGLAASCLSVSLHVPSATASVRGGVRWSLSPAAWSDTGASIAVSALSAGSGSACPGVCVPRRFVWVRHRRVVACCVAACLEFACPQCEFLPCVLCLLFPFPPVLRVRVRLSHRVFRDWWSCVPDLLLYSCVSRRSLPCTPQVF